MSLFFAKLTITTSTSFSFVARRGSFITYFIKEVYNSFRVYIATLDKLETTPLLVVVSYAYLVFSQPPVFTSGYVNTETILHFFNLTSFSANTKNSISIPLDVFRLIAADSFLRSKYLNKISLMSVICFLSKFVLVFVIVVIE